MNRNITPRPIKASGAREAHGRILEPGAGALYVHMHREAGLAHRHYVLKPWQVRALSIFVSKPMLVLYFVAIVTWGWMAGQAAQVPLLKAEVARLSEDARRLDTLSATLVQLQSRYDQVQRLLSAASTPQTARPEPAPRAPVTTPPAARRDSVTGRDTTTRPDSTAR